MQLQGIEYHEGFIHNIKNTDVAYVIYVPIPHNFFVGNCPKIGTIHAFVFLDELQHPEVRNMSYMKYAKKIGFFAIGPDVESTNNVKSLGFITDVRKLIRLYLKMHTLVYASRTDVFPLTLLEAAACRVPIIAFPTRAIRGLGLPLFYATSTNEFAQKINEIQDMWQAKKEDYVKLADIVRVEMIAYDVNKVFPKFLDVLKEVAAFSAS